MIQLHNRAIARHWARTNGAFPGSLRHEWLDQPIIESIEAAPDHATRWLWTSNNDRPNIALMVCRQTIAGPWGIGGITAARDNRTWPRKFYEGTPLEMAGLP